MLPLIVFFDLQEIRIGRGPSRSQCDFKEENPGVSKAGDKQFGENAFDTSAVDGSRRHDRPTS